MSGRNPKRDKWARLQHARGIELMVPLGPVADHCDVLLRYFSQDDVARMARESNAAGVVHQTTISNIKMRLHPRVRADVAQAIMAVPLPPPESMPVSGVVSSVGTLRRVHALMAVGFTGRAIWKGMGTCQQHHSKMLALDTVSAAKAATMMLVYDKMRDADPADFGVTGPGIVRSKNEAKRNGWAPPMCWDEDTIDDPDAFPEWTGHCGTLTGYAIHRREGHEFHVPSVRDGKPGYTSPACEPCRAAKREENDAQGYGIPDGFMNAREVMRIFSVSRATLHNWEARGVLDESTGKFGMRLYTEESVQALIRARGNK